MHGRILMTIISGLLVAAQGCVKSSIPELPRALDPEDGLLVARLYVPGLQALDNARIDVDGSLRASAMFDGYIAIPLKAGEHTLKMIRAEGHVLGARAVEREAPIRLARGAAAPTYTYIPGSSQTIQYTTLAIDRTFRIETGRVTNLGLLVYLPVVDKADTKRATTNDSRRFNVVAVDNGAETRSFLETNYPALFGSLRNRDLILAPAKYLAADKLPDLRRAIAYHELRGPHVVGSESTAVVYGRAGTLVALSKGKAESATSVQVLDPGTLADILGGVRLGDRYTFVTSDGRVLTWEGGAVGQAALPSRTQPLGIWAVGPRGLMVIDNRMRIFTAREPGAPWEEYAGRMVDTPRNDIVVASDGEGAYISVGNQGLPGTLSYLKAGASVPAAIPPPLPEQAGSGTFSLVARRAGLFVLYRSQYGAESFLFLRKADLRWNVHKQPVAQGCKVTRIDDEGREVVAECGGQTYRSTDSGSSWTRPGI